LVACDAFGGRFCIALQLGNCQQNGGLSGRVSSTTPIIGIVALQIEHQFIMRVARISL